MNSKLNSARQSLASADNWLKSCVYQASPSPTLVRSALHELRKAIALVQDVDSEVSGGKGETKEVEDVEALREKLNRKS